MAEKSQESLVNFMKKQASVKLSKQNASKKSSTSSKGPSEKAAKDKDDAVKDENEEEMTDEEKLEEAKKESKGRSENYDKSGMIKKLILESIAKYVLVISLFVLVAIALIQFGPVVFDMMHGIFFKVLMGGFQQ